MIKNTRLVAQMEPFDSFWEAPEDLEKGYGTLYQYYKYNYMNHLPQDKTSKVLVVSCGPGYFVNMLNKEGYSNVLGIDSDPRKVEIAVSKGFNCETEAAFPFLERSPEAFDVIFCECEINHLTKDEILDFLPLCHNSLREGGILILHTINGGNPVTGIELYAINFDHYNTFTENSLKQVLGYTNFKDVEVEPLKLYVFFGNPLNYVGMAVDTALNLIFRILFKFYGKSNKIFSKKIFAVARK